ncbi:MAG: hypothetical protein NTY98_03385 [Verrucomicrobia bacterium]|nr:hypothetical protein [Verrucomicrobiota bacterium]
MAFIFSTSHLPETRVSRPDHLEEEDDEDGMQQPMPRAGGVRAFSHLPVRDNPAPSTSPLREDSPRGEIGPIPPRSATPTSPAPTRMEDQDDPPPSEANPEHDTTPQDHADDRPWYMPRITTQDLPPQDHDEDANAPSPKPWENTTRSSGFNGAPPADRSTSSTRTSGFSPSPQDLRDAFHSPTPDSTTREASAQDSRPALTRGRIFEKRSAPAAFLMQQMAKGPSGPPPQQRLQESQRSIAARQQPVRGTTPPADGNNPAANSQAFSPYQGQASDKMDEGRGTSSNNVSVAGDTGALRPGRSADPDQPDSNELLKTRDEMAELLLTRRAVYDEMGLGNMPISTDGLTRLMELDYQRGLVAKSDIFGMTFLDLMARADDAYLYHIEPNKEAHPGHEGTRGSGFELEQSPKPQYDNPYIKPMIRGKSDAYFSWEINYNVVGQWIRIAGYNKIEAAHFLAAWLAKSPSKWKSLDLDRQTWFWIGYNYANARQRGWHPAGRAPGPKPGNYWWLTPPPASYPSRPQERPRF